MVRVRKIPGILFAVGICIAAACTGVSMAYSFTGSHISNSFTLIGENGIQAVLTEPSWKPENGLLIVPNQVIPKDPQVTNISEEDMDILTALKVEFVYGENCPIPSKAGNPLTEMDMEAVSRAVEIDWNSDDPEKGDWVRFEGSLPGNQTQCFYYRDVLRRNAPGEGDTTVPLFTKLTASKEGNRELYEQIQNMGGFAIRIEGFIVQYMDGEKEFGLHSAETACQNGLFQF